MIKLYANIKYYRQLRKMSQEELAQKVGYANRSAIARIENGEIDLPQSKIIAIAEALNVDPGVLMGSDGAEDFDPSVMGMDVGNSFSATITSPGKIAELISSLKNLNEDGMKKLEEYIADLAEVARYQ